MRRSLIRAKARNVAWKESHGRLRDAVSECPHGGQKSSRAAGHRGLDVHERPSRLSIVLSQVVRSGLIALTQAVIILLVGFAVGVRVHGGVLGVVVLLLVAALVSMVFAGISHAIALLVRREATMIAAANFVGLPLMFLSSILVTRRVMPSFFE